jgi:hypothetical protein
MSGCMNTTAKWIGTPHDVCWVWWPCNLILKIIFCMWPPVCQTRTSEYSASYNITWLSISVLYQTCMFCSWTCLWQFELFRYCVFFPVDAVFAGWHYICKDVEKELTNCIVNTTHIQSNCRAFDHLETRFQGSYTPRQIVTTAILIMLIQRFLSVIIRCIIQSNHPT